MRTSKAPKLLDAYDTFLGPTLVSVLPLAVVQTSRAWQNEFDELYPIHFITTAGLSLIALTLEGLSYAEKIPNVRNLRKLLLGIPTYIFNLESIGMIVGFAYNGFNEDSNVMASDKVLWSIIGANIAFSLGVSIVNYLGEKDIARYGSLNKYMNTIAYGSMIFASFPTIYSLAGYEESPGDTFLQEWLPASLFSYTMSSVLTNIEFSAASWLKKCFNINVEGQTVRRFILGIAATNLFVIMGKLWGDSWEADSVNKDILIANIAAVLFTTLTPYLVYFAYSLKENCFDNDEDELLAVEEDEEQPLVLNGDGKIYKTENSTLMFSEKKSSKRKKLKDKEQLEDVFAEDTGCDFFSLCRK